MFEMIEEVKEIFREITSDKRSILTFIGFSVIFMIFIYLGSFIQYIFFLK